MQRRVGLPKPLSSSLTAGKSPYSSASRFAIELKSALRKGHQFSVVMYDQDAHSVVGDLIPNKDGDKSGAAEPIKLPKLSSLVQS